MLSAILTENTRRNAALAALSANYSPETGLGCCGHRRAVVRPGCATLYLPEPMLADPEFSPAMPELQLQRLRIRYDFEYWAWRCVHITHRLTARYIPLTLNLPQRKLLAVLEADRTAGRPIRVILLKARQWGGSTLVGAYFAWIQIVLEKRRNSIIAAHVANTAAALRSQMADILATYPEELWEEDKAPALRNVKVTNGVTCTIAGRETTVTIGSSRSPDSARGLCVSLAHLSEVGFWLDSRTRSPEDVVRAICSGIPMAPLTAVVMESTANGSGSFFHDEWLRARQGKSDKTPVFVAWHEVEMYRHEVRDPRAFWESMDLYERRLWERGLTLEMIAWYHAKRRGHATHDEMKAEFPTDDVEAFVHSGCSVFPSEQVARMCDSCTDPPLTGELVGARPTGPEALDSLRFIADGAGELQVWRKPAAGILPESHIVAVDVGGRSAGSDYSVIAVLDRTDPSRPEIVAQWRGHCDHDLLAWKAAAIARWYGEALLVVESNTLETESAGASTYILEQLSRHYRRLYARTARDTSSPTPTRRYGFHTNRATKALIITRLIQAVRAEEYVERSSTACAEMSTYRQLPNGGYAARDGCNDDVLMTRAILLYVADNSRPPQPIDPPQKMYRW